MQIGFNNDVEHRDIRYHVQTEDHGLADGRITSQVFRGGQILETITVSYKKAIEAIANEEARDEEIRKRMKALHAHCFRLIKQDKYEEPDEDEDEGADAESDAAPAAGDAAEGEGGEAEAEGGEAEAEGGEAVPGAAILEKPKMPAEPAPAPGLGRVRPLTGLRQPPPLPHDVGANGEGNGSDLGRTISDTAEDDEVPAHPGLEELMGEDLAAAVADLIGDAGDDETPQDDDEPRDPTHQMAPLPDELPEGIEVAGSRSQLGEAFVEAHSRGEVMDLGAELALEAPPRRRGKGRVFVPMYSPQRAFRGLDAPVEDDLPRLLEGLG